MSYVRCVCGAVYDTIDTTTITSGCCPKCGLHPSGRYMIAKPVLKPSPLAATPISDGTCRITATATDGLMTDDPKKRFWLSCGHDVGMYGLDRKPNYCPTCGARVVE